MDGSATSLELPTRTQRRLRAALACVLAGVLVLCFAAACGTAGAQGTTAPGTGSQLTPPAPGSASAALEECVTATPAEQRAVAFSAEMTAVAGTARMAMRIDLEERLPGEMEYHAVTAQGIGTWRSSDPKVKVYKYLKQVTNLSAPAAYRGFVRFRWLNAKGRVIKRADRVTARCMQPAPPATQPGEAPPASGTTGGGSGATAPAS